MSLFTALSFNLQHFSAFCDFNYKSNSLLTRHALHSSYSFPWQTPADLILGHPIHFLKESCQLGKNRLRRLRRRRPPLRQRRLWRRQQGLTTEVRGGCKDPCPCPPVERLPPTAVAGGPADALPSSFSSASPTSSSKN